MKLTAINGSPRKGGSTATMLQEAIKGASTKGFETELIHLCDFNFKGCISCFSCKNQNGKSYGRCAINDALTPILAKIEKSDILILGSPAYIGAPSSMMRALFERLIYPYWSLPNKREMKTGFIYTMSSSEARMKEQQGDQPALFIVNVLKMIFGNSEILIANNTSNRDGQFINDCKKAFNMGIQLATHDS